MFLYNVHTPQKTFALTQKEDDSQSKLFDRIWKKTLLPEEQKSQATLLYEFEGDRWSLDDDDDLEILLSRFPPSSTPSVTVHLQLPQNQPHARFERPTSPSTKLKNKVKANTTANAAPSARSVSVSKPNGNGTPEKKKAQSELGVGYTSASANAALGPPATKTNGGNGGARSISGVSKAKSVMSTKSRRSKWGDDDAEPLGVVKKREWEEFHNNNGVRTVMGKINGVPNIRMLLKSGYRHVYVSREFAIKHKIVPKKFGMGTLGYTGLKVIGNVDITIGNKTATHQAYMSEENYFDVILGRSWLEKMAVKIDPLDQTSLTYMDSGESIACDLVVLKDDKGNVITIT